MGTTVGIFLHNPWMVIGNIVMGIANAIVGGFVASKIIPETPISDLHQKSFSPGGLVLASVMSIISIVVFNLIFL